MKHHIFIAIHYLEIGGAEMSLIGLLQSFDYSKVDVDLFIYRHQGELMGMIPKEVNILPEIPAYSQIEAPMKEAIQKGFWCITYGRLKAKWEHNLFVKRSHPVDGGAIFGYIAKNVTPYLPEINSDVTYDLAISFLTPHNIVLQKVKAKKKACWIHTDYTKVAVNAALELPIWNGYDHIVSISEEVTSSFLKVFPTLKDKIVLIENILSERFVRERASAGLGFREQSLEPSALQMPKHNYGQISNSIEQLTDEEIQKDKHPTPCLRGGDGGGVNTLNSKHSTLKLLSVGRFSYAKNYDNVPDICKRINYQLSTIGHGSLVATSPSSGGNTKERDVIINYQLRVRWYLIGFGGDEALIRQKITEAGMEDHVIILGKKTNPYPYIKQCDIYVQPSRYEGKSVTVREAQILCKPVVVTNYTTAPSQVKDGIDGVIVPTDNEGCADGIVRFIKNKELQLQITDHLRTHHYGNESEVEKVYQLCQVQE